MNQAEQDRVPHIDVCGEAFPPHEAAALARRRDQSKVVQTEPLIGLALSGGGVRSATFCLGLLRAMARNKVLHQVDYLSTVSGGGYTGSAFGRLFGLRVKPDQVEAGLADDSSLLLWWLRKNGRYLLPAGLRDAIQTWAGQLRGFVATQFEVTVLFALLSCIIVLPHFWGYRVQNFSVLMSGHTLWWLLMFVPVWFATFNAFAYWWSNDDKLGTTAAGSNDGGKGQINWNHWTDLAIGAVCLGLGVYLLIPGFQQLVSAFTAEDSVATSNRILNVMGVVLLTAVAARVWLVFRATIPADDRLRFTMGLTAALKCLLLLLALGAMDQVSWFLADQVANSTQQHSALTRTSAGLVAVLVAIARIILPVLQSRHGKSSTIQLPLLWIANVSGMVLVIVLALFWLTALQYFVFLARLSSVDIRLGWLAHRFPAMAGIPAVHAWARWLIVAAPCFFYMLLSGKSLPLINRSSLHGFYRSRIARTYVAVGNSPDADLHECKNAAKDQKVEPHRFAYSPLKSRNSGKDAGQFMTLGHLLQGDDVDISHYKPHESGGPIHLINCCINQTIDDRMGTYNADRKGLYLTVSSLGLETGSKLNHAEKQEAPADDPLAGTTLSQWIAISGAAAGPGMGSMTKTGVAALLFLSGLRLGFWWKNGNEEGNVWQLFLWNWLGKSRAASQELLARFPGKQSPVWYLSDGGHFDNTGVYSLLKRQVDVVVLADCGSDPHYVFDDLENLARKARIDMDTQIDFIDPSSLPKAMGKPLRDRFGTPDSITPEPGGQHLLLARIIYPSGKVGCLLVVKPRLCKILPLDVAGYADRHLDFPQESTSKQFFDEAQWESYCQLGEILGSVVTPDLLKTLPVLATTGRTAVRSSTLSVKKTSKVESLSTTMIDKAGPQTRRDRIGATLGASLGLGVLGTVAFGAWQVWAAYATGPHSDHTVDRQQSAADIVQTELESGAPYDPKMHARLYELLHKYDDGQDADDAMRAIHQLAYAVGRSCGSLDRNSALFDRCLEDAIAMRRAQGRPSIWQSALNDYAGSWPAYVTGHQSANAISRQSPLALENACKADSLATTQHVTLYAADWSSDGASNAAKSLAAFSVNRRPIINDSGSIDVSPPSPSTSWSEPVFLYSADSELARDCAQSMARWLAIQKGFSNTNPRALPVPIPLFGDINAIELRIPQDMNGAKR